MALSATTPPAAVPAELLERELEIEALEAALAPSSPERAASR